MSPAPSRPSPPSGPRRPRASASSSWRLLTAFLEGQREMGRKLDLPLADPRDDTPTVH